MPTVQADPRLSTTGQIARECVCHPERGDQVDSTRRGPRLGGATEAQGYPYTGGLESCPQGP